MATSLEAAQQKLIRKMQTGGQKWDAAKGRMTDNYVRGLQELGVTVGPLTRQSYTEGINAVSGADVARKAAAGAPKWADNFRAALSR